MLDPARLVFIDETGLDTARVRRYGWGDRGARVHGASPHGHWRTSTFVAALRQRGLTAPRVSRGPMDGALFKAYVQAFLCPTLTPGDIVVWDNVSSPQVAGVREAIEAVGATPETAAALQSRFQPHRAGLRLTESQASKGRRADCRGPMVYSRPAVKSIHPGGM